MPKSPLLNISVVLVGTKHPGNLGSVARAMHNMGIGRLRLAAPRCGIDEESARLAKAGLPVLERARIFENVAAAVADLHYVVGTTAKRGGYRARATAPRLLAPSILDRARTQKAGILFGPEDTGLVDADLRLCQRLVRIPTAPRAGSLNLSHAVLAVCYELFTARKGTSPARTAGLAPSDQIEAMYAQLERSLLEIGFLHPQNARHMMFTLRRLFGRAGLEPAEVSVLRGLARQFAWFGSQRKPSRSRAESEDAT